MTESSTHAEQVDDLTVKEVLDAHAQFGRLNYHMVKKAMGKNWPKEWDAFGPGDAIFEPEEQRDDH